MTPRGLFAKAARRGIELYLDGHTIRYRGPKTALADLKPKLAACKDELLTLLRAEQDCAAALTLLQRLKTFTLPTDRMAAAREIARRCAARLVHWENGELLDEFGDPPSILAALRDIERELILIAASPDPELAEAVALVERTFLGARLVEVRKLQ